MFRNAMTTTTGAYSIHIGSNALRKLKEHLKLSQFKKAKFFILVDSNTVKFCLPLLIYHVKVLANAQIIRIEKGENNKNIHVCIGLWKTLAKYGANRKSIFINLGGGVICDMGGFVASTYKRGISFINIPTTLLSQADAAIGGKLGIDMDHLKNQIGLFKDPSQVIIDTGFLKTLSKREYFSGLAEIIKHALIADRRYWKKILLTTLSEEAGIMRLIEHSTKIKKRIVQSDPSEKGLRKVLNFGHTIGHAIESYFLKKSNITLLHGEAVAAGMICESYISHKKNKLSKEDLNEITSFIITLYKEVTFKKKDELRLIDLMQNDKKNEGNGINFTLLSKIGKAEINKNCTIELIRASFKFYHEQYRPQNIQTLQT
jgi:3-dehydroquinate synthase